VSAPELDAGAVWDRLPCESRQCLAHLVDDPPRAALLVSLLANMAATINELERELASAEARELDGDRPVIQREP
jgi:hypothetical protein